MSHIRAIVAIILMAVSFGVLAQQSGPDMNDKKILVIKYDYPKEEVVKESTAKLHETNKYSFHGEGKFDVVLLGERQKVTIPEMSESFLFFDKNFVSVKLHLLPTSDWSSLNNSIVQINQMKRKLQPIKEIAITTEEFDMNKLTPEYLGKELGAIISEYELEHYRILFMIKKLNTPKEIHPRDQDYYQLTIKVDNKAK